MTESSNNEPGGFIVPSYPSPAPSNASVNSIASNLPHPRSHPLKAGSAKEDAARRYVEGRLLHISRRYAKKFQPLSENESSALKGYESMSEVAKDLGEVVDVVWLSGTPSLQIPYLLNIAGSVTSYLTAFPPSPRATFGLLKKLDHAFASLLKGEDDVTGEILPGFSGGMRAGMSKTDMIRCKSLVEQTRVIVVDVMGKEPILEIDVDESGAETDAEMESTGWDAEELKYEMDVARVYEQTIVLLGEKLEGGTFQAITSEG
ncbi:uncharacterized protein LY89DRAFT_706653 [Mollisia scopiformis]|uniref:Meiotic recombination protein DMC1 n=1 Tax=Mollisia scopiformis TaxID=149040 RepID=A0A194XD12_MOLSC|nr:uncharacterized protein LY89DRAFT_706653 [Mollisia scopiformis]KUJ18065.1 hypothetical protein LY89DRAFT_706653 [Mollisia scopiformis]